MNTTQTTTGLLSRPRPIATITIWPIIINTLGITGTRIILGSRHRRRVQRNLKCNTNTYPLLVRFYIVPNDSRSTKRNTPAFAPVKSPLVPSSSPYVVRRLHTHIHPTIDASKRSLTLSHTPQPTYRVSCFQPRPNCFRFVVLANAKHFYIHHNQNID